MSSLLIGIYRFLISPAIHVLAGPGMGCRFVPSCSEYFGEAMRIHGALRGTAMGLSRLLRCHPWTKAGYDPVGHSCGQCAKRS